MSGLISIKHTPVMIAFPAFFTVLDKSQTFGSCPFCSGLTVKTGTNQNVGHCVNIWDLAPGIKMLCCPILSVNI